MKNIRKATMEDYDLIVKFIDHEFTKPGYGFVNRAQIETEILRGNVFVYVGPIGVRIGKSKLWNLVTGKAFRGIGIGKKLVNFFKPIEIRGKCDPVGHLSKKQKDEFVDPSGFYEKLGYVEFGRSKGKNFWAGATKEGKRVFVAEGEKSHIKIYKDPDTLLFKPVEERKAEKG